MNATLILPALGSCAMQLTLPGGLALTSVQELADGVEEWLLESDAWPVLVLAPDGVRVDRWDHVTPAPFARVTVRRAEAGWILQDGFFHARLDRAAAEATFTAMLRPLNGDLDAIVTAGALFVDVDRQRAMPLPTKQVGDKLTCALRFDGHKWSAALPRRAPVTDTATAAVPLERAVAELFGELPKVVNALERVTGHASEVWTALDDPTARWPFQLALRGGNLWIAGGAAGEEPQLARLLPDRLSARFDGAHVRYLFREGDADPGAAADVELTLTAPAGAQSADFRAAPIRAALALSAGALPVEVVPAFTTPDAPPQLWLRTAEGWLHLARDEKAPPAWGGSGVAREEREVEIGRWVTDGRPLALTALLDNTGAKEFEVAFSDGAHGAIAPVLRLTAGGFRAVSGHHVSLGGADQRCAFLPPGFDFTTAGRHHFRAANATPDPSRDPDEETDARLDDADGRRLDRLVLLTPKLVRHHGGPGPWSGRLRFGAGKFSVELALPLGTARVTHWRQFSNLPLHTPLAWAQNDPRAAAQPSPLRGLVPVRLRVAGSVSLDFSDGPFSFIDPANAYRALWDPDREVPWRAFPERGAAVELWGVRAEHLGLELDAAHDFDSAVNVDAVARFGVPQLDDAFRQAKPADSDEQAAVGSERIADRRVGAPRPLMDLASAAAFDYDRAQVIAAARRIDVAPALAAAAAAAAIESLLEFAVELDGSALDLRLQVALGPDGAVRRWSVRDAHGGDAPRLGGLPVDARRLLKLDGDRWQLALVLGPDVPPLNNELTLTLQKDPARPLLRVVGPPTGLFAVTGDDLEAQLGALLDPRLPPSPIRYVSGPVALFASPEGSRVVCSPLTVWFTGHDGEALRAGTMQSLFYTADADGGHASVALDGIAPLGQNTSKRLFLSLIHVLPALVLRETVDVSGTTLELSTTTTGPPIAPRISLVPVGDRLYLTWAADGPDADGPPGARYPSPCFLDTDKRVELRALTRCFILLERRPDAYFQLVRGLLGWLGGALLGVEREPSTRQHVTLILPEHAPPRLELNGVWQLADPDGKHKLLIACWDRTLAVAIDFGLHVVDGSFDVVVDHTLKVSAGARELALHWCALQTARVARANGPPAIELSGVFALAPYGDRAADRLRHRRPGVVLTEGGRTGDGPVMLAVLPRRSDTPLDSPTVNVGGAMQLPQEAELPAWTANGDRWREPSAPAGWSSARPTRPAGQPPAFLLGLEIPPAGAPSRIELAGYTLYRDGGGAAAWLPSGVSQVAARDQPLDDDPTLRVLGDTGLERLYTFDRAEAAKPDQLILHAAQILAGARWDQAACLEWIQAGDVTWTLVASPLPDRHASLAFATGDAIATGGAVLPMPDARRVNAGDDDDLARAFDPALTLEVARGEVPEARRPDAWTPSFLRVGLALSAGAHPPRARDLALLGVERAAPFEIDRGSPFDGARPWFEPRPPLLDGEVGKAAFVPSAIDLGLYSPRPGEKMGYRFALAIADGGGAVVPLPAPSSTVPFAFEKIRVAPDRALIARTPRPFDGQETITVAPEPLADADLVDDGRRARRVRWRRVYPERVRVDHPVMLALANPGLPFAPRGRAVEVAAFVDLAGFGAAPPGSGWQLALRLTRDAPHDAGAESAAEAAHKSLLTVATPDFPTVTWQAGVQALALPFWRAGSPPRVALAFTFADEPAAAGAWSFSLAWLDPATHEVRDASALLGGAATRLDVDVADARVQAPATTIGLLRSGPGDAHRLVLYGAEQHATWTAALTAAGADRFVEWQLAGEFVDRVPPGDGFTYQAITIAGDGTYSSS